jgi:methylated-DNA-[protein]-cysteine S-methyltransferase
MRSKGELTMSSRPLEARSMLLHRLETPIGLALLVTDERGTLRAFDYIDYEARMRRLLRVHYEAVELRNTPVPSPLEKQIERYFAGDFRALDDVACETNGTPFQRRVWQALRAIPPGTTTTYGGIARSFGMPNAARAIGLANGSNPIAIVVPCHRVIGADGALTGYAGGLHRKQWLLDHERAHRPQQQALFIEQPAT